MPFLLFSMDTAAQLLSAFCREMSRVDHYPAGKLPDWGVEAPLGVVPWAMQAPEPTPWSTA
jgi:hypothetical protein